MIKRRAIVVTICVLLLFAGAYIFGQTVSIPLRAGKFGADQTVGLSNPSDADVVPPEAEAQLQAESAAPTAAQVPSLVPGAAEEASNVPVSFFLRDIQYLDMDATIQMLHRYNVTALTVPLVWSMLEPEKGGYTTSAYEDRLDRLAREGFHFIFLIDGAARKITEGDEVVGRSVPDWVYAEGAILSMDFMGQTSGSNGPLSYASEVNQALYLDFAARTIDAFGERYADSLYGFAPAVMPEFEIKYPQENFAWNDFSEGALEGFRRYEREQYGSIENLNATLGTGYLNFGEILIPVVNYNNSLAVGELYDPAIYVEYQRYRERQLVDYIAPVYDLIHGKGYTTYSYFGQVLHPHDGIYAAGIAVKLADYVDVAVIDFNFYDGYDIVLDSMIPAMMTNYLKTAGYDQVWTGLYLERIDYLEHRAFLQETIDYAAAGGVCDGFELGSIPLDAVQTDETGLSFGAKARREPARIAIYVSEWNFYHSHGESPVLINYFNDCVTQMYKILQFELGMDVDILCDERVLAGALDDYELLVVPGQYYVASDVKAAIEAYLERGGRMLQDYRFGEWNEYGQNTGSWSDAYFDIAAREALRREAVLEAVDPLFDSLGDIALSAPYPGIPNTYAIAGNSEESRYLFKDEQGKLFGIRTDRTICLCYQPEVQYKYAQSEKDRQSCVQVIQTAVNALLK